MTSTYLGYKIYTNDYQKSLLRTAAEPSVSKDQAYYKANIDKVKSVDDFLNNYKLFTYAMKAFGLEDLGNAKALMKKVLESNLSDPKSFANQLSDSRYTTFAKAFNFLPSGAPASAGQLQTAGQRSDLLSRLAGTESDKLAVGTKLDGITSVAALEADTDLYTKVLAAYGVDKTTPMATVTAALESDLSDPMSAANRSIPLRALAQDFNFSSSGNIGAQHQLQSPGNRTSVQSAYLAAAGTSDDAKAAAQVETAYYAATAPTLTSVDQLLGNNRLVAYIKTAFGIDPSIAPSQLRNVLTSDLADPKSVANTFGQNPEKPATGPSPYQLLASAFSIGTDGTAWDHGTAMPAASVASATAAYAAAVAGDSTAEKTEAADTAHFVSTVASAKSVDDLLSDTRIVTYLQKAFNLPTAKASDLRAILTSNVLDPNSTADAMGGTARTMAASFNFASNGLVYVQRPIQSAANATATTAAYMSQAKTDPRSKTLAQTETDYFNQTMPRVKSVDGLLSDKRLVAYLEAAYAIPTSTSTLQLRQALTSNLDDPKSTANQLGGGFVTLAASLDVASDGSIAHLPDGRAQTRAGVTATTNAYLEQQMETEAGDQNAGVRLALYFRAKAPSIKSAYDILADKALTKVAQTMLGLSDSSSKADIDAQARTITQHLNLADLKDPAKLDKLVARFAALYDLTNNPSPSPVLSLFGG